MARVLVGIPTYNRPEFVRDAVYSVLSQTYADWRLIVSDNASDEPARAEISKFIADLAHPQVSFHQQKRNAGEYGQGRFFYAQALADGSDYLVILHDDDVMVPSFLESAMGALDARPELAFFACNPYVMTGDGTHSEELTEQFMEQWQRKDVCQGEIDVLSTHMRSGFTPVSGAFFRMSALQVSGFVDDDLHGCFPFESNIFLRLGERGARAWFCPRRLLGFRWHSEQMTNWGFLQNEQVVSTTIQLYERRRFKGENEKRRRQLLGRLHRILAVHRARAGDVRGTRKEAATAIRSNPTSVRTWIIGPLALVSPFLLRVLARKTV